MIRATSKSASCTDLASLDDIAADLAEAARLLAAPSTSQNTTPQPIAPPDDAPKAVHTKKARPGATVRYEAHILEECAHPNVVKCYGMSENASELHLEEGECDLYSLIEKTEEYQLEPQEVLRIAHDIGSALGHMHELGYAHNDMKVENVVMCRTDDDDLVPKIIDMEFASKEGRIPPEGEHAVVVTDAYFSPEREAEISGLDRKAADMWALGVTLHLAAFGCFPNGTIEPLPICQTDYRAPEGVDPVLGVVLECLMKVSPTDRMTAGEVVNITAGCRADRATEPPSTPPREGLDHLQDIKNPLDCVAYRASAGDSPSLYVSP